MKRTVLGRGLEALIPDKGERIESRGEQILKVPIEEIHPNPFQSRTIFDREKIEELVASIKERGIIQPLLVRKRGESYELIAGERRWRAAQQAGIPEVPVIVREISDAEILEISLIENIQREDLNPLEEAGAYKKLIEKFNHTQEELAARLGKNRSTIANSLRLLRLPEVIKHSLQKDLISMGHARSILSLESHGKQVEIHNLILKKGLSVRQTENTIKRIKQTGGKVSPRKTHRRETIFYGEVENELTRWLATRVRVMKKGKGGKIVIEFYSLEELERILERIKGGK
jgi:ParB family chromosome partitioning protein